MSGHLCSPTVVLNKKYDYDRISIENTFHVSKLNLLSYLQAQSWLSFDFLSSLQAQCGFSFDFLHSFGRNNAGLEMLYDIHLPLLSLPQLNLGSFMMYLSSLQVQCVFSSDFLEVFDDFFVKNFMCHIENQLEKKNMIPSFYRRYVNDESATDFLQVLNSVHPSLSITMELEHEDSILFFGTVITRCGNTLDYSAATPGKLLDHLTSWRPQKQPWYLQTSSSQKLQIRFDDNNWRHLSLRATQYL